jgi:hypothetical protein
MHTTRIGRAARLITVVTGACLLVGGGIVETGRAQGPPPSFELLVLLGRAWSEPQLIKLAYAYEQATRHRRPPASTPALGRP